jgi:branched-chain amino acid transport system substrate-binding protein
VEAEKLITAFKGLGFDSPFGPVVFRPQDNQSTLGIYVGRTALVNGKGVMKTGTYIDGAQLTLPDADIARLRTAK